MTGIRGQRSVEGLLVDWSVAQQLPDRGVPVALLTQAQKAAELQRVQARRAMDAAYEAELVMGLADDTPDTLDPPPGHPGARKGSWAPDTELPGVSEFFVPELAVVLNCGRGTAAHLAHRAFTYRHDLPATRAALAAGVLDQARAKALADALAHTTPATAQAIEARLLGEATGLSLRRLRDKALALLLEHDADAIDKRREDAGRQADVRCYPSHREGMATLAAELPADEAAEGYDLIDRLAQMAKADGDARPIGQIRAEVFSLLIRRPADHGLPAVRAEVTVTAALDALEGSSTTPGQVNGQPITAAHVRALLARIGALDLQAPEGGSLTLAITDAEDRLLASASPAQLARLARRGCRTHPRRRLRVFGPGPAGARPAPTPPPPPNTPSSPPATAPAASPTAATGRLGRTRPRHPARRRRGHRLRQPLLPVPQSPPAEDPRPRLALRHDPRRRPARHHPLRGHPHHPTTRDACADSRANRASADGRREPAADSSGRRSATVLTSHDGRVSARPSAP